MSTTNEIKDSVYGKLLVKSLPPPIRLDAELARLTGMLLALDELDNPSPEEEALAEMLTLLIEATKRSSIRYQMFYRTSP